MKIHQFTPKTLDRSEKALVIILFSFLALRMLRGYLANGSPISLIYLFDQAVILIFMLLRRPAEEISVRLDDWLAGFAGTFLPLMLSPPTSQPVIPIKVAATILMAGILIHLLAKLTLRRSFGAVAANRGVKATGAYRYVRHPMYLGYMLVHIGLLLSGPSLYNFILISSTWILFFVRIESEERILSTDPRYQRLISRTRYRLLPYIY